MPFPDSTLPVAAPVLESLTELLGLCFARRQVGDDKALVGFAPQLKL